MKIYAALATAALAALLAVGLPAVFAQDADAPTPIEITVDGVNYCVLCALSPDDAAGANSTYATMNALRVTAAVGPDDNLIEALEGRTLHYLPTAEAMPLLVGEEHQDATVSVEGDYYADAGVIRVKRIKTEDIDLDVLPVAVPVGRKSNEQEL